MKQYVVLVILLFMCSGNVLFSQVTKKETAIKNDKIAKSNSLSGEEGWLIHRKAFTFQLEAQGYTATEIKQKLIEYDKQKEAFISINEKLSARLMELRNQLGVLDAQTAGEKKRIASLKQQAQRQELKAMKLLKQVKSLQIEASAQKKREKIMLAEAKALKQQAVRLKSHAKENYIKAKTLRGDFKTIFKKKLTLNSDSKKVKSLTFKVLKSNMIHLNISGSLELGQVLIEVRDPQGEKKGQLTLDNSRQSDPTKSTNVSGSLNKYFNIDVVGEWSINVISTASKGDLKFSIVQYDSPEE